MPANVQEPDRGQAAVTAEENSKVPRRELAIRIWQSLETPDRALLGVAAVLMVVASIADTVAPVVTGDVVNIVVAHKTKAFSSEVVSRVVLIAVLMLGAQLLQVGRRQLVESVATRYERDMRVSALTHAFFLPTAFFDSRLIGQIYGRITRGIEGSAKLLKLSLSDMLPTVVLAVAAVVVAMIGDFWVGLAMLPVIPTSTWLVSRQTRSQDSVRQKIRDDKERIDGEVTELLPVSSVIRSFHAERFFAGKVQTVAGELREKEMAHHNAMGWFDSAKFVNETVWFLTVLGTALWLVRTGHAGPGEVLAASLLYTKVLTPLRELHRIQDESSENAKQAHDLYVVLDEPVDPSYSTDDLDVDASRLPTADVRDDRLDTDPAPATNNDHATVHGTSATAAEVVRMQNVTFAYPESNDLRLVDIDLPVLAGQRVVLIGQTGCGKSTVLRVLLRLYSGYSGDITMFGRPLDDIGRREMARRVAYVEQGDSVVHGTIRDNIVFGLTGTVIDDDIHRAAKRAELHDTIMSMPLGYDTMLHERGKNLSGGQRQRVGLARALLREPELLVLDEPTAALDPETHDAIQATITSLSGVTIIEVTHRYDGVQNADLIAVMDNGKIVERGTYAELVAAGGLFAARVGKNGDGDLTP